MAKQDIARAMKVSSRKISYGPLEMQSRYGICQNKDQTLSAPITLEIVQSK